MDLVAAMGLIYLVGLVIVPILIRILPGANEHLHEMLSADNPAVAAAFLWPVVFTYLLIYHTCKFIIALINWVSGNGFITKTSTPKPGGKC